MLCIKCGFDNTGNANCCSKCGARLPRMAQENSSLVEPSLKVNERLQVFEEAVRSLRSGQWDTDRFVSFLSEMSEILAEKERGIRSIAIPTEAYDEFREELAIGFSGMELYNRGIAKMQEFVSVQQDACLDEGLSFVRQGNEAINEAMRINRENRAKLEELVGEPRNVL